MLKIAVFICVCGSILSEDVNTDNWPQVCASIKSGLTTIGNSGADNQTLANDANTNTITLCAQEQQFYQDKVAAEQQGDILNVILLYTYNCLPIGYCMYEVDQLARYVKTQVPSLPSDDQTSVSNQLDSIIQNIETTLKNSDLVGKIVAQLAPLNGLFTDGAVKFFNFLHSI